MKKVLLLLIALCWLAIGSWGQTSYVSALGSSSGWYSDDTRNISGTVLNGLVSSYPPYFAYVPGTVADDQAIAQQIKFGVFYSGASNGVLQLDGTTANLGKSSVKYYFNTGIPCTPNLANFTASYRWYMDNYTTSRTVALSLMIVGSDNNVYSMPFVGEGAVASSWNTFSVDATTTPVTAGYGWFLYGPGAPGGSVGKSLNDWLADPTWGPIISGGTIVAQGFNIGSYQRNCRAGIDWLQSSILNGGNLIDFVSPVHNLTQDTYHNDIQPAIDAANPNDVIQLSAGTFVEPVMMSFNKAGLTLQGAGSATVIQVSGTGDRFDISASGVTIKNLAIQKTDKTGVQNIIYIHANNFTLQNTTVSGQFVIGEGDVSRAIVTSAGYSGLLIDGNTFFGLRQPGYFSGPTYGTISNNNTYGTKGWVMEQGGMDFVNNTWGVNVYDIAILSMVSPSYYSNIVAMSEANNDAVIEDQRVSPAVLSVARVDGSTSFSSDLGGRYHPYSTIAPAITRVVAGGKILVAGGSYNEDLVVNKAARIFGAGSASTTISGPIGGAGTTMQITAGNVLIDGFKITRDGNNPADWNLALNLAGIAIQGLTISNVEIRNCDFFGNRTGIDINNSNGHNIHHNIISNNRTGLIFRNQTDNLTVINNVITDNWTVGVLFLDASSGTNVPVQTAAACVFEHNNISGNWYGQVVDRQTGGSLPAPGANMKNFERNYWGTMSPVTSTASSTEPGYSAQIPVIFGGTATPPGGQPDILGAASANIDYRPWCNSDFTICTFGGPGPVTTIGNGNRVSCSEVEFPITVDDLIEVGGISLTLNYNPAHLTYQSVSLHSSISSAVVNGTNPGTFILSYFTYPGFSLPNNTVLFTLRFTMNPAPVGTITNLSWAETPVEANEYGDIYGNAYEKSPFATYFVGNSFTFPSRPVVNTTTLNEYCTIQSAIDAASNGHTITVAAGNYPENLNINKAITLSGANAGQPCYGTRVPESVITGSAPVAVTVAADGVTIDGFSITNPGGNFAIYAEGRNNTLVTNNIISSVGNTALSGATHAVAFVMGSSANISGVTVTQNCISDIHGGENPALTGAAAKANNGSASAISLGWSNAAYDVENVLIGNNTVTNVKACTKDWLEGGKGAYGVIINVGASGSAAGKAVNPIISCNSISDLEGLWAHGVGLEGETPGAQVKNNWIDDLTDHKTPTDAVCVLIEDNAGAGSVVITDNSFTNMGLGIQNKMAALVNGEGNWWGTTGPIPALVSGSVDWKPFLDGGGSSTLAPCFTPTGLDIECVGITLTETNVPVSCFGGSNGSIDLTVSGIAPFSYAWTATLGGSIPSGQEDDQDLSGLTAGTYTVVVTDGNECTETLQVVISVADATAPTITTCPPLQNIEGCAVSAIGPLVYSESLVEVGASDFTNAGGVATDNCSITYYAYQDTKTGACPIVVSRTWTLKDGMGNTSFCYQTINVDDNTAPVITVPVANLTMECFDAAVVLAWTNGASALDACDGNVTVTPTYTAPTSCEAVVEVTFTAVDACGNTATATKSFSVEHVTPPAVPANGAKTVACPAAAVAPTLLPGVPDQQQLLVNTGLATPYWIDFTSIGQSFTCGTTGWLTQLDLRVGSLTAPQNFTMEIYQGSGIAGTLLYSGNHTISATGWQSMSIPQNVAPYLTAGSQYTFWITPIGFNQLGLFFTYPNAYTGGVSMDGCTSGCTPTYAWQQWPDYDLTFRTYMSVMPTVTDVCGTVILTPAPVVSGTYNGCEGTIIYTYTYTDCAFLSTDWTYTYTIERNDFTMPANGSSTVACIASATQPVPPSVNDNCGSLITPTGPTIGGTYNGCEGTRTYTWNYLDCEGNTHNWVYTYTIERNDFTVPANPAAVEVACYSAISALLPTPPAVTDNCGNALTPTGPVESTPLPACEGTVTYTWTYTDCEFNTHDWVATFNIERNDFTVPANPAAVTVSCYTEIAALLPAPPAVTDNCGTLLIPTGPVESSPVPTCEGTVTYTWTYTDCEFNTHDWVATFTINYTGGLTAPAAGASTVSCPSAAVDPGNPGPITDACGRTVNAVLVGSTTPPACEGTVEWTYRYTACDGTTTADWTYTYTIEHLAAPAEVGGPVSQVGGNVECEVSPVAPAVLPVVKDVCGTTLTPSWESPVINPTNTISRVDTYGSGVNTSATAAAGKWYVDRYAPAGFTTALFGGDYRLKHSINAADGASSRPGGYSGAFYNTQGRKYNVGINSVEIKLFVPSDWATSNKRMAGFWGTGIDANYEVSAYPIIEFTSDANTPRFRAYDNGIWVDMGLPSGFAYDSWVTLKMELLPSKEFKLQAGDLSYTTVNLAVYNTVRLNNVILQGHNYDPANANLGVTYDIYWDDFSAVMCEGTLDYVYRYVDCAGLQYSWLYSYNVDHVTAPVVPANGGSTVSCVSAATVPVAPVVTDVCGVSLTGVLTSTVDDPVALSCEGTRTYTFTFTDCAGLSSSWSYVYTIDYSGGLSAPASTVSTVSCPSLAVDPGAPADILDACGRTVSAVLVSTPTIPACEGTVVWLYRYTACDGITTADWSHTYTIDYSGGLTAPVSTTSTVSCPAAATDPGVPAAITDACGRTVNAVLVGSTTPPACEGTVVWTYRYTACDGTTTADWTHTYTVDYSGGLTAPAAGASTVSCPSAAVDPGAPVAITDACGRTVNAVLVGSTTPPACNGTVVWTYRYTACDGTTTADWTYTYTIVYDGGLVAPAAGASTVSCPAQAVDPGNPGSITDACGRTVNAVLVGSSTPPSCNGEVIWTYRYTACDGTTTADWTYTYTILYSGGLTPPANGSSTVAGPAQAVNPGAPANILDACGRTVVPTYVGMEQTPDPVVCEGNIVYRYRYTACDLTTADWTYTYTVTKSTLTGTLKYNNVAKTPMNNVTLTLLETGATAITSGSGNFSFADLCPGTYTIAMTNSRTPGGVNSTDAGAALGWFTAPFSIERVKFLAGEVTASNQINAVDAQKIQQYFVFGTPFDRGTWTYWKSGVMSSVNPPAAPEPNFTVTITGNTPNFDIYAMCVGDFNGSFTPSSSKSASSSLTLLNGNTIHAGVNQEIELPIRATYAMEVGAVSLIMDIPSDLVEVTGVRVNGSDEPASFTVNGNELRIGWNSLNPVNIPADGDFVILNVRTTEAFVTGESIILSLSADPLNELADGTFEVMEGTVLIVDNIDNLEVGLPEAQANAIKLSNYPNPFRNSTTVTYSIPVDGKVKLEVQNLLGQTITTLVEETQVAGNYSLKLGAEMLQQGIYSVVLKLSGKEGDLVRSIKLVVNK